MKRTTLIRGITGGALAAGLLACAGAAQAQATRTWVSGVGDDVNPCSRTAPCKTFAGAISKTGTGGEINVLDPGGFGAVTITKSITISSENFEAGVLVSGTNGITVNGAGATVVLRGLDIEGLGTGLSGIRVLNASQVFIENCVINAFRGGTTALGIDVANSAAIEVYIKDTVVRNNGLGSVGGGIQVKPTGAATAKVVLDNVRMENNVFGFKADGTGSTGGIQATIRHSTSAGNSFSGLTAITPVGGAPVNLMLFDSASVSNGTGVISSGSGSTVRISDMTVTGNGTGLASSSGGALVSYGTNNLAGNTSDGAPTGFLNQN